MSDMAVFHKKIVVSNLGFNFHSAINCDQPGEYIVITNQYNVICFGPIAFVFGRCANDTKRTNVIVFPNYDILVNNGRWMNEICFQYYFDFFAFVGFTSTWTACALNDS